jgi:hypothetical protein
VNRIALSPATTEAYGSWWSAHSAAWAARYARDADSASAEYEEVQKLWQASEQALGRERARLGREARPKRRKRTHVRKLPNAIVSDKSPSWRQCERARRRRMRRPLRLAG